MGLVESNAATFFPCLHLQRKYFIMARKNLEQLLQEAEEQGDLIKVKELEEILKIRYERQKIKQEALKLMAERNKIIKDTKYVPYYMASALVGVVVAIGGFIKSFFK